MRCVHQVVLSWAQRPLHALFLTLCVQLYFCVVTLTTIGFGDLTNTPSLRWFATVYVLVGISFAASALAFVAGRILERQERLIATHIEKEKKSKLSRSDTMRSMAKGFSLRPSFIPDQYANVYNSGMTFVILVGIGVFVFVQWQGLNVRDALYMLIVAATTVGYGDVAPDTDMLKLFSVVYLPMLSLCMGKLAGDFADLQISGKQDEIKERFLKRTLRKEDFLAMDADGDGQIDKFEWLSSTLIEQGTISPSDLQHIMSRFEELDADGTGAIDAKEAGVL